MDINIKDFILEKYTAAKASEPNLEVVFENELAVPTNEHGQERCKGLTYPFASCKLINVPIKNSNVLSEANGAGTHNKYVMEITLDIENMSGINWQPGDTIAVLPSNSTEDITNLLNNLGLCDDADRKCYVRVNPLCSKKTAKVPNYIPSPSTTPREILQDCINIKSILKKQFLSSIANFCSDSDEKSFLKCLSSKEGSVLYNDLVLKRGFTILDVLKVCPTCKPPLNLIIEHFARLLPRPYSIANSALANSKEINIIFSVLKEKPGVATNMLSKKAKQNDPSILMYLREPNLFRYTDEDFSKNQILIAIGTGLAPFLGFLQHKEHLKNQASGPGGECWLFVGATTQKAILYRDKLVKWQSENVLQKFVETHSRSSSTTTQYVQDALMECSAEVVELLIQPQTVLYLCADGGEISRCIEKTISMIIEKELLVPEVEALQMLKEFKVNGKYREDLWV